ncbi:MAG TPA: hypothetical protein VGN26_24645 [Armatimonadota bacterium]
MRFSDLPRWRRLLYSLGAAVLVALVLSAAYQRITGRPLTLLGVRLPGPHPSAEAPLAHSPEYLRLRQALLSQRLAEARGWSRQLLQEQRYGEEATLLVVSEWMAHGLREEAAALLEDSAKVSRSSGRLSRAAELCQTLLRSPARAERLYREALALTPRDPWILNNLSYLYAETGGHLGEALEMVNRALKGSSQPPTMVDTRAWVYYQLSRQRDTSPRTRELWLAHAREDAQNAVQGEPTQPELRYHLGAICRAQAEMGAAEAARLASQGEAGPAKAELQDAQQNLDAARVELMKAVWLDPHLSEARALLDSIHAQGGKAERLTLAGRQARSAAANCFTTKSRALAYDTPSHQEGLAKPYHRDTEGTDKTKLRFSWCLGDLVVGFPCYMLFSVFLCVLCVSVVRPWPYLVSWC